MMTKWNKYRKWMIIAKKLKGKALRATFITAVLECHWEMISACVEAGIDINCHVGDHVTALHLATDNHNIMLLNFLLLHPKININAQNFRKETCLAIACRSSFIDVVTMFLKAGANAEISNNMNHRPLHHACLAGDIIIVRKLLDYGVFVNVINTFQQTPLHIAANIKPHIGIVQMLLDRGADPYLQNLNIMPILLECCLHCHSEEEMELIRLLLDNGIDINTRDYFAKRNCLHIVALTGYVPLVELLIERGVDKTLKDRRNLTAYDIASVHNRSIARIFRDEPVIEEKCDVHEEVNRGRICGLKIGRKKQK